MAWQLFTHFLASHKNHLYPSPASAAAHNSLAADTVPMPTPTLYAALKRKVEGRTRPLAAAPWVWAE